MPHNLATATKARMAGEFSLLLYAIAKFTDRPENNLWLGNYQDTIFSEESNHYAYQFWRDKVHARVKDPAVAEKIAPAKAPYPFGTKRPSLEQWYYEIFNQDNVKLVDMNETPILRLTEKGIETANGEIEFDIIAFATGFDAVTGGITSIEAQPEAQEEWRKLIANFWETTLFPRAKSWYAGANIPGKKVESLNFPLGLPTYIKKFKESANQGYADFALSR